VAGKGTPQLITVAQSWKELHDAIDEALVAAKKALEWNRHATLQRMKQRLRPCGELLAAALFVSFKLRMPWTIH
jgi:hypothetical protein